MAFTAVMTVLVLGIAFLSPVLTKIFNKFTPLADGELKERLTRENFGELAPDPLLVKLTYSHPTLSQRITAIEEK